MNIKRATVVDLEDLDLYSMGVMFYTQSKLPGTFNPAFFKSIWTTFIEQDLGAMFMLLDDQQKLMGVIGGLKHPDPYNGDLVAQEMFWFVHPAHKSKGAVELYNAFEGWAKEIGAKRLCMACVCNSHMKAVRKFYERKGYRPVDVSYFKNL